MICSKNNDRIKSIAALKEAKYRRQAARFCIEGIHLLEEFLRFGNTPLEIFATPSACQKYGELIDERLLTLVSDEVYAKISDEKAPQGILCVCEYLPNITTDLPQKPCVILDNLRDNGNVGTIIRTAASLGLGVALSAGCADIYAPKTIRATMGAVFALDIHYQIDTVQAINALRHNGFRVLAADMTGDFRLGDGALNSKDCVVIGNEGGGVSDNAKNACDGSIFIPMSGKTESLNAAAAASIIMWEMAKNG